MLFIGGALDKTELPSMKNNRDVKSEMWSLLYKTVSYPCYQTAIQSIQFNQRSRKFSWLGQSGILIFVVKLSKLFYKGFLDYYWKHSPALLKISKHLS